MSTLIFAQILNEFLCNITIDMKLELAHDHAGRQLYHMFLWLSSRNFAQKNNRKFVIFTNFRSKLINFLLFWRSLLD